jgi:hypothetical protein
MTTPFGPQLIGETEKTLNAVLRRHLDGTLTEPEWVTLRIASMLDGTVDHDGLVAAVGDRAHFADAPELVDELTARVLLADGRLTPTGTGLVTRLQTAIADDSRGIFGDLDDHDVAATARVLEAVLGRARAVLAR